MLHQTVQGLLRAKIVDVLFRQFPSQTFVRSVFRFGKSRLSLEADFPVLVEKTVQRIGTLLGDMSGLHRFDRV